MSKNTKLEDLIFYKNQIRGTDLDNLIASLPVRANNDLGDFIVVSEVNEGHVCTRQQVEAAKARGWTPYYFNYIASESYPYDGSSPRRGDVNDDNSVDVTDIATIIDVMAGKGGNKSEGYNFAGSYFIEDVAWYEDNSSTQTHDVATSKANE